MDITLIPQAGIRYDKALSKNAIYEADISALSDCSMVLLHKSGLRPLYVMKNKQAQIHIQPKNLLAKPDLIVYDQDEAADQSAHVILEQLRNGGCSIKAQKKSFTDVNNINIFKNAFLTFIKEQEEKGYQHLVIVDNKTKLDKMAYCINNKGLNPNHNLPIYSFSGGKEINDENLISYSLYITRDILDGMLVYQIKQRENPDLIHFAKKHINHPLEIHQIKKKIHLSR